MRSPIRHAAMILLLLTGAITVSFAHAGDGRWTSGGPYGKSIKDLLAHPTRPNTLYAGAFGLGVLKSTDGGVSWQQHRSGLRNSFVRCLAMDTAHPETLYVGTNDGLYRSYDGDSTWVLLFDADALATPTSVRAVTLDRFNPGAIYLGTYDNGIFKSVDYGATWTPINLGLTNTSIRCIAVHPTNPDTVLAGTGTNGGVFTSADGGLSWIQCPDTAASVSAAVKIVYDPTRSTRIFVATGSHGVIVSHNGGVTWSRLARGLTSFLTRSLAVVDTVRYVGTDSSGVFYATLSDTLWRPANNGLTNLQVDALLARSRTEVWAGTDGGGAYHTTNGGGSWSQAGGGMLFTNVFALGISPTSSHVYSGTGFGDQFWTSANQGGSWTRSGGLRNIHSSVYGIANEAGSASTVYAAITNVGVLKSFDNAATWTNPDVTDVLKQRLLALVSHPVVAGRLYAGAYGGVYKSIDGGVSWAPTNAGLPANAHIKTLALSPVRPDTLFAGTDSLGVFVSLNGGTSWSAVGPGITGALIREVMCDPVTPGVVFVTTDFGVFRSTNNGANWATRNTGLPATPSVRAIAGDPLHPGVWFVGVWQGGVFWSADSGANWIPLLAGLASVNVNALAVDAPNLTVYAGTQIGTFQFTNYPLSFVAVEADEPSRARIDAWPNPFQKAVSLRLTSPTPGRVSLEIFDLAGRRVRRLLSQARMPAGPSTLSWDGRDDQGALVSAGIYVARLTGGERARSAKLALVR